MPEKPVTTERHDAGVNEPLDDPPTDPAIRVVKKAMRKELNWQGAKLTIATAVVAVGTAFGAYRFLLAEAAAQTDAGVKVHEARITTLEQQRKDDKAEVNNRFDRVEVNQNADHSLIIGVSQKMDALLRASGVPNPAPTPKDAGP